MSLLEARLEERSGLAFPGQQPRCRHSLLPACRGETWKILLRQEYSGAFLGYLSQEGALSTSFSGQRSHAFPPLLAQQHEERVTQGGKELQETGEQSGRAVVHEFKNRVSSAFHILRGSRVTTCLEKCLPGPKCAFGNFLFSSVCAFFFFL